MRKNTKRIFEAAERLIGEGAPSYITVKRLSASGALDGMTETKAVEYLRNKYQRVSPPLPSSLPPTVGSKSPLTHKSSADEDLTERIRQLTADLAASKEETRAAKASAEAAVLELKNAANQLGGINMKLMSKYDAVCSQQIQTIETLRAMVKELQQNSSLGMEIGRMRSQVQNMVEKVTRLERKD